MILLANNMSYMGIAYFVIESFFSDFQKYKSRGCNQV